MSRPDDRDPDASRDAWTCDDIATVGLARRSTFMPPSIVASEESRLAELRAARVEPTDEERKAASERWMARFRAGAGMNLFRESRRR